jgi:hypothetical protein
MLPSPETVQNLVGGLLDRDYQDSTRSVLSAITRGLNSGALNLRLQQFQEEADRLTGLGQPLSTDNPVLAALMADLSSALRVNRALLNGAAPDLQNNAVTAALQLTPQLSVGGGIGVRWNTPDPEAVARIVETIEGAAWEFELDNYETGIVQRVNDLIIRGIINGQGPRATARQLAMMVKGLPRSSAETLMRSVQLNGYRAATAAMQRANADIIGYVVRIAVLDSRTCLSCVALHGTRLEVGEEVDDHRNGRCTSVSVLKGATGIPTQTYYVDGKAVTVQTGEDWLRAHGAKAQRDMMGNANYAAFAAGQVQLRDFIHRYDDPLFGNTFTEASLKGILGEGAKQYYTHGGGRPAKTTGSRTTTPVDVSGAFSRVEDAEPGAPGIPIPGRGQ